MEKESDKKFKGIQLTFELSTKFPGFKFSPSDEELITYYLKKKLEGLEDHVSVIPFVEINKFDPWDLPDKSAIYSECEWFYFSPRERKYRNGSQNKRATESGYWKATGKERTVKSGSTVIGTKRTLVFHAGRAPKAERTHWIMHEFCTIDQSDLLDSSLVICRLRKNSEFRVGESRRNSERERTNEPSSSGNGEKAMNVDCPKDSSSNSYTANAVDEGRDNVESDFGKKLAEGPSSPRQKTNDDEEDFYADILKDKLVDLDETLMSPYPNSLLLAPYSPVSQIIAQNPIEAFQLNAPPPSVQTGENRAIKITSMVEQLNVNSGEELGGNVKTSTGVTVSPEKKKKQRKRSQKKVPSCIINLFRDKSIRYRYAYICCVFIVGFMFLLWLVDHFIFPIKF